jgi:hypothetical protein
MTNNKAIEIIADFEKHIIPCDEYGYRIDSDLMEAHSMAVKALRNEWIPVTERLPEPFEVVCVYVPAEQRVTDAYMTRHNEWVGIRMISVVTHWMPLPEPPKED